jgi:hypothetical protein
MRTVLKGSHLFIGTLKLLDNIFISNRDSGEESRIAERQRESVRGSALQKRRYGVVHKMSC